MPAPASPSLAMPETAVNGSRGDEPLPDPTPFVQKAGGGLLTLALLVEGIRCAGCVERIERELGRLPEVREARVNFTTRRLSLTWQGGAARAGDFIERLRALGFSAVPFAMPREPGADREERRRLLLALGVTGFASANVMLLSVSVWAGAVSDMDALTRDLFHWISALIVLPAAAYGLRPFARNALAGLRRGQMVMDLPITVAVVLTLGVSLFATIHGELHVYFEAAIMLLFFLLVGRVLDQGARARAMAMGENLMVLRGIDAVCLAADGTRRTLSVDEIRPGMRLLVAPGCRIPADGNVVEGRSEIDASLLTGESLPVSVAPGTPVLAGTLNRSQPLTVLVSAAGEQTVLADIARLAEAASQSRSRFVTLAQRTVRWYAPVVHLAALLTFLAWWGLLGLAWPEALMIAVAVLIITCPCALGLAVPVVQVVAVGRLLRRGIIVKSQDALERLAAIDHVVIDKTGTLTRSEPALAALDEHEREALSLASGMAGASRHPLCRALSRACAEVPLLAGVEEIPGAGLAVPVEGGWARLGRRGWAIPEGQIGDLEEVGAITAGPPGPELWLSRPGQSPVRFRFEETLKDDASLTLGAFARAGMPVELLSGDREEAVALAARAAGLDSWRSECAPAEKIARLESLERAGRRVLMIGDGLNDAPALSAASVSASPAHAADITQAAADFVFQGESLAPVAEAWRVARRAQAIAAGNITLALLYNLVAVPLAVLGHVTPLIAAVAMSLSSLMVIANALRLAGGHPWREAG